MLTRIRIRNFKRFEDVDIELGSAVVLIGPNDSGKTTALQAIALWDIGVKRWNEKRKGKASPEKRPGVTVNRRDLLSIPVPDANLLWRDLRVRDIVARTEKTGKASKTQHVMIDIIVDGITRGKAWSCGLEFYYANQESFYCRPPHEAGGAKRMPVPEEVENVRVAFLPAMSGLADREFLRQPGEIGVLIGQGQTAQILRNLCFNIHQDPDGSRWTAIVEHIKELFGIDLLEPQYIAERSEITMAYKQRDKELDLSSSGRGCQQTLLLLAHLYAHPGEVLLLDEPDAHLEMLRQRETYNLLIQVAEKQGSQIIAASHSEVVLKEAAGRDVVVAFAFVGKPHRIDDRGSQVLKALRDIGFDQYVQAEETGWVLYLEGSTDLDILQAFARSLDHDAQKHLKRPFVHYVGSNSPQKARDHFNGLKEAKPDLVGIAIFDRLDKELQPDGPLIERMWRRREIENYLCMEESLVAYATHDLNKDNLFDAADWPGRERAMRDAISEVAHALKTFRGLDPWSLDVKASDEFLDQLFKDYFQRLGLPLQFRKSDYHVLAGLVPKDKLDPEITEKLDAISTVAQSAKRREE
jgi:ABC-type lipoprotein export system ATPase subunit